MKHLILGIAVLVLLLALCLGAAWSLDRTAEQVCSLLEAAWSSETLDEAAGQVAAAHRIWEKNRGISASLVDHERLEDVDEGFSDLQAWLQLGEESGFARTCLSGQADPGYGGVGEALLLQHPVAASTMATPKKSPANSRQPIEAANSPGHPPSAPPI